MTNIDQHSRGHGTVAHKIVAGWPARSGDDRVKHEGVTPPLQRLTVEDGMRVMIGVTIATQASFRYPGWRSPVTTVMGRHGNLRPRIRRVRSHLVL